MLQLSLNGQSPSHFYRLASEVVGVDREIAELEPLRVSAPVESPTSDERRPHASADTETLFADRGWIAGADRHLVLERTAEGYRIEVDGVGRFLVAGDGRRVERLRTASDPPDPEGLVATVLGPVLILALALRGLFCLHASAIAASDRALAFVGESGAGKSTLGAHMTARSGSRSQVLDLVADDAAPVSIGEAGAIVWSSFPQLKLAADEQPGTRMSERLALQAIWVVDPVGPDDPRGPRVEPLEGAAAILALARHTIGARLFAGDLLSRHLDHCSQIARIVPVSRLVYPQRRNIMDELADLVAAALD